MKIDNQAVLDRFSGMIRFATVSNPDPEKMDYEEFYKFHRYLEETFPLIHQHLEKEVVSRASLLYRWKGDGSSNRLPCLLYTSPMWTSATTPTHWNKPNRP